MGQGEAPQRRLMDVGNVISTIASAKATATKMRQRQELKSPAEQAFAASQYFRRHKVIVGGLSSCHLVNTNLLLITRNPKVIWEEPRRRPSRQRMVSPAACSSVQCPLQTSPITLSHQYTTFTPQCHILPLYVTLRCPIPKNIICLWRLCEYSNWYRTHKCIYWW